MEKLEKLIDFVKEAHHGQLRKYTSEPYFIHLEGVMHLVAKYDNTECISEIAICHDLLEDTKISISEFRHALLQFGYSFADTYRISSSVEGLTDHYTKEKYPQFNRNRRKELEAIRLWGTSSLIQNVKCADIIDNVKNISEKDPKFAFTYLAEKNFVISNMTLADADLRILTFNTIANQWENIMKKG